MLTTVSPQLTLWIGSLTLSEMVYNKTSFTTGKLIQTTVKFLWHLINIITKRHYSRTCCTYNSAEPMYKLSTLLLTRHLVEMGKVKGNPSPPMGPGYPRAEDPTLSVEGTHRQHGPRRLCFIPCFPISRQQDEKQNNSLTSMTHQDLALHFKC